MSPPPSDDMRNVKSVRDGFMQRILAIDQNVFSSYHRYYVKASFCLYRNPIVERRDGITVMRISFLTFPLLLGLAWRCGIVYIHSLYGILKGMNFILLLLPKVKCIFDVHGIVPEEEKLTKGSFSLKLLFVEYIAIRYSTLIITVSKRMNMYLKSKYTTHAHMLSIPIFTYVDNVFEKKELLFPCIVYAGGVQKWQLLPLMCESIAKCIKNANYFILTNSDLVLREDLTNFLQSSKNVTFASLTPDEVGKIYPMMHYGFLLRDSISVNAVSCPTKLIEYMSYGVVPILKTLDIGDFISLGMKYVSLDDFLSNRLPDFGTCKEMALENKSVLDQLRHESEAGIKWLRLFLVLNK